jgi:cellulose biosynthesis protein BcsQ
VNCNPAFALAPYLSGAQRLGTIAFLHHPSGTPGVPVTIVDASPSSLAGGKDESSTAMLVKEAILHADIVLFDMPAVVDDACRYMLMSADHIIVPITPDLRSECGIDVLESLLRSEDWDGPELHYILNRYDHSRSFHRAVRARMEISLQGRLNPVVVREEALLQEALASGQAIGDYAPKAVMAQDLYSISDWLQQLDCRDRNIASELTAGGVA